MSVSFHVVGCDGVVRNGQLSITYCEPKLTLSGQTACKFNSSGLVHAGVSALSCTVHVQADLETMVALMPSTCVV